MIWKIAYCEDEDQWQKCARITVSESGQSVPDTMLPNGKIIGTDVYPKVL